MYNFLSISELNPLQFEQLIESDELVLTKKLERKKHFKILLICLSISIVFHTALMLIPMGYSNVNIQLNNKQNATLNIQLIASIDKHVKNTTSEQAIKAEVIMAVKSESKKLAQENPPKQTAAKSNLQKFKTEAVKLNSTTTDLAKTSTTTVSLETFRESFSQNTIDQNFMRPTQDPSITLFDQSLKERVNEITLTKQKSIEFDAEQKRREDNQYFEFQGSGELQIIRINGRCFFVPEKDPFALVQKDWIPMGGCEKKQILEFKPGFLSHQYDAGEDGKRSLEKSN